MHEQSLLAALLRQIEAVARDEGASRVAAVDVWVGALSHLTEAHFREHFEQATGGTIAQGAEVRVTVSDDLSHPDATGLRLQSVDVVGR